MKKQGVDYEQSLFFLGPSSRKARDMHALPSPNLKKKRDCWRSKRGVKGVTRKGFDFPTFPKLFTSTLSEAKERDHRGPSCASTDSKSWPDDMSYISSFPAYKYIKKKELFAFIAHSVMHAL